MLFQHRSTANLVDVSASSGVGAGDTPRLCALGSAPATAAMPANALTPCVAICSSYEISINCLYFVAALEKSKSNLIGCISLYQLGLIFKIKESVSQYISSVEGENFFIFQKKLKFLNFANSKIENAKSGQFVASTLIISDSTIIKSSSKILISLNIFFFTERCLSPIISLIFE